MNTSFLIKNDHNVIDYTHYYSVYIVYFYFSGSFMSNIEVENDV